jgi:hypothetical protein
MGLRQSDTAVAQAVSTILNYSVDTGIRPKIINADHTKNVMTLAPYEVAITDASLLDYDPTLAREGFCRVGHVADIQSVTTSQEATQKFRETLVPLMLELTGADEILFNPYSVVRRQAPLEDSSLASPVPVSTTANFVHTDFSLDGAAGGEVQYPAPSRSNIRRSAMFNIWKLLSPGPTNIPLALCDSASVVPDDVIPGDSVFPDDSSFETAFLRYNSNHRWYYFSDLNSEQVLVFKQADTDQDAPRIVPHTAFSDNSRPPAASRVSIESRCRAVWFD